MVHRDIKIRHDDSKKPSLKANVVEQLERCLPQSNRADGPFTVATALSHALLSYHAVCGKGRSGRHTLVRVDMILAAKGSNRLKINH